MRLIKSFHFETGPASPKTTAIGLAFAASVILFVAVLATHLAIELDSTGYRATGVVVKFVETGSDQRSAVFLFKDWQGGRHLVIDTLRSTHEHYEIGEKVALVYAPDDPSSARRDSRFWLYFAPTILGLMSLLFYTVSALVWRFQGRFQKDYQSRRGIVTVTKVQLDGSVTVTEHSSVPVFRWTGFGLGVLGAAAGLTALTYALRSIGADRDSPPTEALLGLLVMGSLLMLGAMASLRHARFLAKLESSAEDSKARA